MKILLAHPEGNLNYNVNLLGMLDLLGEAGHQITYVAPRRPQINQELGSPFMTATLLDGRQVNGPLFIPEGQRLGDPAAQPDFGRWAGYDLILGVDRAIVECASIARHYGVPHALLSYEICFREEISAELSALITEACRDLSFAIAQDSLRRRKLCLANAISPERVLQIPVAGRGFRFATPKPRLLHRVFQLPERVKTVLHLGSFADWTHSSFLLESTRHWPKDWVLVIHERYGPSPDTLELVREHTDLERVRVSEATFANPDQMSAFIQSADIGVALYNPTYKNEWEGRNVKHIGLASGKIATYLQHGIPVATHELGEISDWIRLYGAGQVFSLEQPFVPEEPPPGHVEACRKLFETHLDLARFGTTLLEAVASWGSRVSCAGRAAR